MLRNRQISIFFFFLIVFSFTAMMETLSQDLKEDSRVRNQAVSNFFDPISGHNIKLYSNSVQTKVKAYSNLILNQETELTLLPGSSFYFDHTIKHSGNTSKTFKLRISLDELNAFEIEDLEIKVIDFRTRRTVLETTLNELENESITQNPGQSLKVEINGRVSPSAKYETSSKLTLHLEPVDQSDYQSKTNKIFIDFGADIRILKSVNVSNAVPGDTLTYKLRVLNNGNVAAQPIQVATENGNISYVLISDELPANTSIDNIIDAGNADVLVHFEDDTEKLYHYWRDSQDNKRVEEIAFGIPSLEVGEAFESTFQVFISFNASGNINNTAQVDFKNDENKEKVESNEVVVELEELTPNLKYFQDSTYSEESKSTRIGTLLHLKAEALGCNEDRNKIDQIQISLLSELTKDYEVFTANETGKNTGVFIVTPSVPTRDVKDFTVKKLNETLETTNNDRVEASISNCGGLTYSQLTYITVSPVNRVYDSRTNQPIQGAQVSLIKLDHGNKNEKSAFVYEIDQVTPYPNVFITNKDGLFELPSVIEGEYKIEVIPPANYAFPSVLAPELLPAGNKTDRNGSYGRSFFHTNNMGAISIDVPLDAGALQGLSIDKSTSKKRAEIGDFIEYTIKVKNESGATLGGVYVIDELPVGFTYEAKSARLDNQNWVDPSGGEGPVLRFEIGTIDNNQIMEISYRLLVGPGAMQGNGINKAQAFSTAPLIKMSNVSSTKTEVTGGVFSDNGYLTGTVYYDRNKNGLKDAGEEGIPGVRLYLNNGTFVITDGEGKYSLYGLKPQNHVLKLDPLSLPAGSGPTSLTTRNALDGFSHFISIPKGGLEKVNLPLCRIGEDPENEIFARRKATKTGLELQNVTTTAIQFNEAQSAGANRVEAEGYVNSSKTGNATGFDPGSAVSIKMNENKGVVEEQVKTLDTAFEFMGLAKGDTLGTTKATFNIKGSYGGKIKLYVNGEEVSEGFLGNTRKIAVAQVQIQEYVGIQLVQGSNILFAELFDSFGNKRDELEIEVFASGTISDFKLDTNVLRVPANGKARSIISITPVDEKGIANNSEVKVTLSSTSGTWLVHDLNPSEPGVQTFIKGKTLLEWKAGYTVEQAKLEVHSGIIGSELSIEITPDLRPLLASGLIEGTVSFNNKSGGAWSAASDDDGFYKELEAFTYSSDNNEFKAGARSSFYLKGKVLGKYLLTMSFDSEKDAEELFRDIQPDVFYPVYGDASVKGFDAQSTSKLYVRVDDKRSFIQYGDYVTQTYDSNKQLGRYNRSQTGLKAQFEKNTVKINTYGALSSGTQIIDEIPGAGISGPYMLSKTDVLINSEQVSIVVRNLSQPEQILNTKKLTRFVDYTIDAFTGMILLSQPLSSVDSDLNPVSLRVVYESETGGKSYLSTGADVTLQLAKDTEIGAVAVKDFNNQEEFRMQSLNFNSKITSGLEATAELARAVSNDTTKGNAARIELSHKTKNTEVKVFGITTDSTFVNSSSPVRSDRTQLGVKGKYKFMNTSLLGEYIYSVNDGITSKREGGSVGLEQRFNNIRVEAGTRFSRYELQSTGQEGENFTLRSKITSKIPRIKNAEIFGEYEQELRDIDRKVLGGGASYEFLKGSRLYARHEFISSLGNRYDLSNSNESSSTVFGVDAAYSSSGKAYSEYRVREGISGQEAQAAFGLRNRWDLGNGIKINGGMERIRQLRSGTETKSLALTSAIEYTGSEYWKTTGRAEYRRSSTNNYYFNTAGVGYKLNGNWTLLAKNFLAVTDYTNTRSTLIQNKTRIGAAYRNIENAKLDALFRYEYKVEKTSSEDHTSTHVFSTHAGFVPSTNWRLSGRMAAKHSKNILDDYNSEVLLGLLSGKVLYQLNNRWDVATQASILSGFGKHANEYGFGMELGYTVARNTRMVAGYNVFGLKDKDLVGSGTSKKGVYLTMSFKFDEQLFQGLISEEDQYAYYNADCACEEKEEPIVLEFEIEKLPATKLNVLSIGSMPLPLKQITNNIHFATDKAIIDSTSAMVLKPMVEYLIENEQVKIKVEGVTDERASIEYNLALALRRATAVKKFLESYGIDSSRIQLITTGERVTEKDAISLAMNREVNIYLIGASNVSVVSQYEDLKEVSKK
ncbi:MAG: OmpA family protein [Balneola sp.]